MTLIDTNVLLDVVTDDPRWGAWSLQQLEAAGMRGTLFINAVVYAELSIGYDRIEELDAVLEDARIVIEPIPCEALFLAGKAFLDYRSSGGTKTGVLPDFFIGAHAAVGKHTLLTRDVRRYRRHFPTVRLIAPDS